MRNCSISFCIFLKWLPRFPYFLAPISSDILLTLGPPYFPLFCLVSLSLFLRVHQFLSIISSLPQFFMLLISLLPWLVLHSLPHASTCSYITSPLGYFRKPITAFMQKAWITFLRSSTSECWKTGTGTKSSFFWDIPCYIWDAGANCVNQQLELSIVSEEYDTEENIRRKSRS